MSADSDLARLRGSYERDYDPFSPASMPEHLAGLADRRKGCPVSFAPRSGSWVLTTYDDISGVLRRNNRGVISFPNHPDGVSLQGGRPLIPMELDGAEHRQYRTILDPLFSPKNVARFEPELRAAANQLFDSFIETGECDFIRQFALPFPGATVMAIMGWPAADLDVLKSWVESIHQRGEDGATAEELTARQVQAQADFRAYMRDFIRNRRANPGDDVSSHLLRAEIGGKALTDDDLCDAFMLMMLAGLDTVESVFTQSAVYFAQHPGPWQQMFALPENLDPAIEEILRLTSPAVPTRTITDEFLEVGGIRLPRGERVHVPLAAANRDPQYYPEPNEMRFGRAGKPHLSFGLGPHRCLGVHLARLELRVGFAEWHRRMPVFFLNPDRQPVDHLGLGWGVSNVHLRFPPGPRVTA